MDRVYFLLPNADVARSAVDAIVQNGIERRHSHIVANQHIELDTLPDASLVEGSELKEIIARGIAAGVIVGTIAGLAAILLMPAGVTVASGAVLASTLADVGFGEWLSTTLGLDQTCERYRQFVEAIRRGDVLLIVETHSPEHVELIKRVLGDKHPGYISFESGEDTVALIH
ncbi:DUF1269 domain-containing protein [Paraburkholderia guartelaensis]|uniref:DUF1269 domain-containing protein n=1 Tax=Paraburkholderia guartelaensis TaxID=2546446 RepID=UPI002AB70573|nr:DUF1269 domain-containing protein [Paraburkholderia guartelaensis]